MNYSFGDIVLVRFPYTDSSRNKIRPSLILLDTGDDDVLLAKMTSRRPFVTHDIPLSDWKSASLPLASIVRLHKINTIAKTEIIAITGRLSQVDRMTVLQHLKEMWSV